MYYLDGEESPEIELHGDVARELADFVAMRMDLEAVMNFCDMREQLAARPDDSVDMMMADLALWEASVVAYGRSFMEGKSALGRVSRTPYPRDVIDNLSEKHRAVHDKTIEHRRRHVGHRVNDWLQVKVTAVLAPETHAERGRFEVAEKLVTVVDGAQVAAQLREVATILRDALVVRIQELERLLKHRITTSMTTDELYEFVRTQKPFVIPDA